jgi:methionyl-tRNA formyltransferase
MNYLVAAIGEWNKILFDKQVVSLSGNWKFISTPEELNEVLTGGFEPRYIFFPHWRWIVPEEILNHFECVCFHMTDLPYGRGGSPLQNLIVRGHKNTVLTALRMEKGLDTGPVYIKKPLSLQGAAKDIYVRSSELTWGIIKELIAREPRPEAQVGEPVVFKRRTPEQSEIGEGLDSEQIYDYIRMLDAPGYPKAFLDTETYHLEFEDAKLEGVEVVAKVKIRIKG